MTKCQIHGLLDDDVSVCFCIRYWANGGSRTLSQCEGSTMKFELNWVSTSLFLKSRYWYIIFTTNIVWAFFVPKHLNLPDFLSHGRRKAIATTVPKWFRQWTELASAKHDFSSLNWLGDLNSQYISQTFHIHIEWHSYWSIVFPIIRKSAVFSHTKRLYLVTHRLPVTKVLEHLVPKRHRRTKVIVWK